MEIRLGEAQVALARWPLSQARLVGSLPGGARNVNILVDDAGGSRYVLRCCRRNPSRDRIRFQLDFQDHLRCRGIPTAEVVVTETGDRYVVTDAASLWVLFRFVQGNAYRYGNRAQLENAARCLSDIHGAAADFTAAPVEDDTIPDLRRWWNTLTRDLPWQSWTGFPADGSMRTSMARTSSSPATACVVSSALTSFTAVGASRTSPMRCSASAAKTGQAP